MGKEAEKYWQPGGRVVSHDNAGSMSHLQHASADIQRDRGFEGLFELPPSRQCILVEPCSGDL